MEYFDEQKKMEYVKKATVFLVTFEEYTLDVREDVIYVPCEN